MVNHMDYKPAWEYVKEGVPIPEKKMPGYVLNKLNLTHEESLLLKNLSEEDFLNPSPLCLEMKRESYLHPALNPKLRMFVMDRTRYLF
jgi:hypothetical protein